MLRMNPCGGGYEGLTSPACVPDCALLQKRHGYSASASATALFVRVLAREDCGEPA